MSQYCPFLLVLDDWQSITLERQTFASPVSVDKDVIVYYDIELSTGGRELIFQGISVSR